MSQARIASKLVEAGRKITNISKSGRNDFHKYDFVTDADVLATVRSVLLDLGISTLVNVVTVDHHFYDDKNVFTTIRGDITFTDSETGEQFVAGFAGTGSDKGDKGYYKAVTGGVKYALLKTLLIPTGDDPEATDEEGKSTRQQAKPASSGPTPPAAEKVERPSASLTDAQRRKLMAALKQRGIESDDQRRLFVLSATGKHSSRQMDSADLDKALAELEDMESKAVANALAVQ